MADQASWPIVIFGAPRSGTTYLNTLVNTHPEVYVTHETRVLHWLHLALRRLPSSDRAVKTHRALFVGHLEEELPEVVRAFYRRMRPHARYWGDKNPFYGSNDAAGALDTVAEVYPGARFVHILRDGRDVAASLVRKISPDGEVWTTLEAAGRVWVQHVDNGVAFGARRSAEDYLEIRFEDLIADDLGHARRLFSFLGIELAPETVEFCEKQRQERTVVSGATSVGGIGSEQWRLALSVEEQVTLLRDIGPHLVRYGYETEESLRRLWLATADLG